MVGAINCHFTSLLLQPAKLTFVGEKMRPTVVTISVSLMLLMSSGKVLSTPVDNGVEGAPEIECGPTTINVDFNTVNFPQPQA